MLALLEIEALSVSYGKREVLSRVSLSVKEGEVLAVLGHNGAGKTTLLKSVVSLVRAESGGIHLDGTQLCNTSPRTAARREYACSHRNFGASSVHARCW